MSGSVYVLGAGFSHGYDQELFPLVSNFPSLAKANHFYGMTFLRFGECDVVDYVKEVPA